MWSELSAFLQQYAYLAILVGAFFEGESTLLIAGLAAEQGRLDWRYVLLAGAVGGFCGDQAHFWTGRLVGRRVLSRRPKWLQQSDRLLLAFKRRETLFLLAFRYLYGLRTVASVALGTCGVNPVRFAVFDLIGAFLWSATVVGLGYQVGEPLLTFLSERSAHEIWALGGLIACGMGIIYWWRTRGKACPRADGAPRNPQL